ncbi:MAG: hypothetical protein K8T10_11560 [Candidatus Eremiobacteraeota bacterium]|nr:hypothetical protein [Candidatus Eremiobacteraeota bacterium]
MKKYILTILLLIIFIFTFVQAGAVFAENIEKIENTHSLFYIRGHVPVLLPFVLLWMILFAFVAPALLNGYFSWLRIERRLRLFEKFAVQRLILKKESHPINPIDSYEFISGIYEDKIEMGKLKIGHEGVFLLSCENREKMSVAISGLVEKITSKWNRSVIYSGREESSLFADVLREPLTRRDQMRHIEEKIAPYLHILPAFVPDPDTIYNSIKKPDRSLHPCAVIIEDAGYKPLVNVYKNSDAMRKLDEISGILKLPIFIIGGNDKGRLFNEIAGEEEKLSILSGIGTIKVGKGNEIYIQW